MLLHELHGLLVHLGRVALVLLADGIHLRLKGGHPLHRPRAGIGQGPESQLDEDGQHDNRRSIGRNQRMNGIEQEQERLGADAGDAREIHHEIDLLLARFELTVLFGPSVDRVTTRDLLTRPQGLGRIGETGVEGVRLRIQPTIGRQLRRRRCRQGYIHHSDTRWGLIGLGDERKELIVDGGPDHVAVAAGKLGPRSTDRRTTQCRIGKPGLVDLLSLFAIEPIGPLNLGHVMTIHGSCRTNDVFMRRNRNGSSAAIFDGDNGLKEIAVGEPPVLRHQQPRVQGLLRMNPSGRLTKAEESVTRQWTRTQRQRRQRGKTVQGRWNSMSRSIAAIDRCRIFLEFDQPGSTTVRSEGQSQEIILKHHQLLGRLISGSRHRPHWQRGS